MSDPTRSEIPPAFSTNFLEWFRDRTEWRYMWRSGLDPEEISRVEAQWQVRFPPDYRLFLEVLHAADPPAGFYNWSTDSNSIAEAFNWPAEGLEFDVRHNDVWLESWGWKPTHVEQQVAQLGEMFEGAPRLIPVIGHRYLVAEPYQVGNPVLSIYQSDIIVYGGNLRDYFLVEFMGLLGLGPEQKEEVTRSVQQGVNKAYVAAQQIPFWGELLEWNAGP
jgi:hypothetical protein